MTRGNLRLCYSHASRIGKAKYLKLDADYSNLELGTVGALNSKSRYSYYRITSADEIQCDCYYGHLAVKRTKRLWETGDYHQLKADTVFERLNVSGNYDDITVGQLAKGFEAVDWEGGYNIARLGIAPQTAFSFDLNLKRTAFHTQLPLHYQEKREKISAAHYAGWCSSPSAEGQLRVDTRYGLL